MGLGRQAHNKAPGSAWELPVLPGPMPLSSSLPGMGRHCHHSLLAWALKATSMSPPAPDIPTMGHHLLNTSPQPNGHSMSRTITHTCSPCLPHLLNTRWGLGSPVMPRHCYPAWALHHQTMFTACHTHPAHPPAQPGPAHPPTITQVPTVSTHQQATIQCLAHCLFNAWARLGVGWGWAWVGSGCWG